jgi:uncharacterized membrane protein YgcG
MTSEPMLPLPEFPMRNLDFSSWPALLSTLLGLAVITLIGVGIRLIMMQTIQIRRERENRQINERLRVLMAAYKTLGGSFTGTLTVDPTHLRDLRRPPASDMDRPADDAADADALLPASTDAAESAINPANAPDRPRRIRDAVEAALSDILLLGTEDQVRLAARAAMDLAQGHPIHTAELVVSLRDSIRSMLRLGPVPDGIPIPAQGPTRPAAGRSGAGRDGGKSGSGGKGGGGGMGGGGMGLGMGLSHSAHDDPPHG